MTTERTPQDLIGKEVKLWVGLTLEGYPERGVVRQWLPDYPGGPVYEVVFPPNDFVPVACLPREHDWDETARLAKELAPRIWNELHAFPLSASTSISR